MSLIQIYARLRPTCSRYEGLETREGRRVLVRVGGGGGEGEGGAGGRGRVTSVLSPATSASPASNPPSSSHDFKFARVFEQDATQEDVFQTVAVDMLDRFLAGYNGTIFAYGQTASGKTYTIEGSGRQYKERGLVPRVLSYLYKELEKRSATGDEESVVKISYMELYQDVGYDLLNPGSRPGSMMVTLPKVSVREGANGEVLVHNLSLHLASTEEVAQSLLFQGSTCRKVAETSMNQCSSRSHSIFSIILTTRPAGSEVVARSKLNLVDLAGSERVAKTGADGRILQEAKHINLSLHHLEHVIVVLQHQARQSLGRSNRSTVSTRSSSGYSPVYREDGRSQSQGQRRDITPTKRPSGSRHFTPRPRSSGGHVPYRNCLLTMVLKDSIGGNCVTAMIATISLEKKNIWETISTCKFSQRVACISNRARRNEELDDKAMIKKLKQRVAELEAEIRMMKLYPAHHQKEKPTQQEHEPLNLSESDKQLCHKVLHGFLHGDISNPVDAGIDTVPKFQECLLVLRNVVLKSLGTSTNATGLIQAKQLTAVVKKSDTVPKNNTTISEGKCIKPTSVSASSFIMASQKSQASKVKASYNSETSPNSHLSSSSGIGSAPEAEEEEETVKQVWRGISKILPIKNERKATASSNEVIKVNPANKHESVRRSSETLKLPLQQYYPLRVGKKNDHPAAFSNEATCSPGNTQLPIDEGRKGFHKVESKQAEVEVARLWEREQQKLSNEITSLSLRTKEQTLQDHLAEVGEQLARQHVKVVGLQSAAANLEQICAERIAEQQLRIKQARLHQQLLDTQFQLKQMDSSSSHGIAMKQQVPQNELLSNHELQKSKVQQQIEKLKFSQLEKQLDLKEAATRRRLMEMKRLLEGGSADQSRKDDAKPIPHTAPDAVKPPINQVCHPEEPNTRHVLAASLNLQSSQKSHNQLLKGIDQKREGVSPVRMIQPVISDSFGPSNTSSVTTSVVNSRQRDSTPCSNDHTAGPIKAHSFWGVERILQTSSRQNSTCSSVQASSPQDSTYSSSVQASSKQNSAPSTQSPHRAVKTEATPNDASTKSISSPKTEHITEKRVSHKETVSGTELKMPADHKLPPQNKLSVPEEKRELEYQSSLQKQKARVARIRKCISAATIIQRAWRLYYRNKRR